MPTSLPKFIVVLASAILAACSPNARNDQSLQPSPHAKKTSDQLHQVINNYRASNNLPRLKRHPGLDELALGHTRYLLKKRGTSIINGRNVTHFGAGWRAEAARNRYQMISYGENLAAISTNPDNLPSHLLLMWKTSYGHNKNMLAHWTHTGIATLVDEDGTVFATQVFGELKR